MTNAQTCSYNSLRTIVDRVMVGSTTRIGEPIPMHGGSEPSVIVKVDAPTGDREDWFIIEREGCIARTHWSPS